VLNNKNGKPTILIHSNNQNIVYLETPFYLKDGHGATSVLQSKYLNEKNALYIMTSIKKVITKKFAYNEKATKIALKNTLIELPVNNKDEIDYNYMEKCITTLEKDRIKKLSSFISTNGLEDCELTEDEKKLLNCFQNGKIPFSNFKIIKIFEVKNTHSILKSSIVPGSGTDPYVTAGEGNNSITTYISYDKSLIEEGNSIVIGGKTLVITYQPNDYYSNDSHNLSLYIREPEGKTEKVQLFLVSALYKSLNPLYSWGDSISKTKIKNDIISLPITEKGNLDFDFMKKYITIQEKVAAKDVLSWVNKILKTS